ncbi:MAG: iron-sulfur cluster assembly scaffold protein [Thermodesulfobacteriota bacterium]|nr:iron-sulfur cluster assembly scaffold protein [Thermodesulfobacteriota bacterium]
MSNKFDSFVQDLQEQIFEETREEYGEVAYERWRNPLYTGIMKDPDVHAIHKGTCGDTISIFLKFENGHVKEASFVTDGCGSSMVCGSFAAEMAMEKNLEQLFEITGETILEKLGGFPKEDEHCAFLAAETLHIAANEFMIKKNK